MSLLYDSNISKTLALKETVDVIADSIVSLKEDPATFRAMMPTRWTIEAGFDKEHSDIVYNKDSILNKVLASIFQGIKREGLTCADLHDRITLFVDSTIKNKANSIFGSNSSDEKTRFLHNQVWAANSFFVSYYKNFDLNEGYEIKKRDYIFQSTHKNNPAYSAHAEDHATYRSGVRSCGADFIGIEDILLNKEGQQNFINVEKKSSLEYPHMSVTMINSPLIKGAFQNELEMHTFLNSYNSLEFSKCIPYIDVNMSIPRYSKKYEAQYRSNASISSFLYPDHILPKSLDDPFNLVNKIRKVPMKGKKEEFLDFEEINISTFAMPQTAVNLNTKKFGLAENYSSTKTLAPIIPHDLTRPFMTIKKLDLDVVAAGGLLAYKSGVLSLLLHDRTRMRQIAAFIDPALQGGNGPRLTIEFGWSHPSEKGNILGKFLNESKVKETFMIQNSRYNMESDGSVNIDLNISQISGRIFTKVKFNEDVGLAGRITVLNDKINRVKQLIIDLSKAASESPERIETDEVNLGMYSLSKQNLNNESAKKITNLIEKIETNISRFENAPTVDNYQNITNLIIGEKITIENLDVIKKKMRVIDGKEEGSVLESIKSDLSAIKSRIKVAREIQKKHSDLQAVEKIKQIIPNVKKFDPFFDDTLWKYLSEDKSLKISKDDKDKYVTFGSIVSGLIATHITAEKIFTDIQLFSYTCNSNCGYMSNRNIFSILIKLDDLNEKISKIASNNLEITLEQFVTDIYTSLIQTEKNHSWGTHFIFQEEGEETTTLRKDFKKLLDLKLIKINKKLGLPTIGNKIQFRIPALTYVFNSKVNKDKKYIFKASYYDKHDNPFKTLSDISNSIRANKIKSTVAQFRFENAREIERARRPAQGPARAASQDPSVHRRRRGERDYIGVAKDVINENLRYNLKSIKKKYIDRFFIVSREDPKISKLELKKEFNYDDLKEGIKSTLPSITYGTENSAVTSMSLTSMNEGGLTEVRLAEMNRRKERLYTESKINANLPLKIFPASANVELIGCPFVNFNQAVFLDFQTGTIADNTYVITGIKHTLSPGKFNTSLTLSPNDAYGYYESHIKGLESLINSDLSIADIDNLLKIEDEKEKVKSKKTKTKTSASKAKSKKATKIQVEEGDNCLVIAAKKYDSDRKRNRFNLRLVKHAWNNFKVHVDKYAAEFKLEPTLIWSVMAIESSFNIRARNAKSGATGLMQFIHKTAISQGLESFENKGPKSKKINPKDERLIPEKIIRVGAKYLSELMVKESVLTSYNNVFGPTEGKVDKLPLAVVLSSYNAGPKWTEPAFRGLVKLKGKNKLVTRLHPRGPRKWAFDETKTNYIDPILEFKGYLDKCLLNEDGKEEASTATPAIEKPVVATAKNDDDDVRKAGTKRVVKVKKGRKTIVALDPEVEEKSNKVKAKEKVLSRGKIPIDQLTQDVYLFTPANQFKVFAYLCLAYPVFKKKNGDEFGDLIEEVDFIIRENISNRGNTSIKNITVKGFEALTSKLYADDPEKSPLSKSSLFIDEENLKKYHSAIFYNFHRIDDIYNRHVRLFNKRIEHGATTRGYNLISALIAENTSEFSYTEYYDKDKKDFKAYVGGNATKESRDYFKNNVTIGSSDNLENDIIEAIKKTSIDFYFKSNDSLFGDIYENAYEIEELLYAFVRYSFRLYETFLVFKDKVDINSNVDRFNKSILELKAFSPKIHKKVTSKKEYKIIKSNLKRKSKFIEDSFYINKIIYASEEETRTKINANIINHISHSLLNLAFKYTKSVDVNGMFGFINADIIVPDINSVGQTEAKFKRYFNGEGVLVKLEASIDKHVGVDLKHYLTITKKPVKEREKGHVKLLKIFEELFSILHENTESRGIKSILPYLHNNDTNNILIKNCFYIYIGTKETAHGENIINPDEIFTQTDKDRLQAFKDILLLIARSKTD